MPAFKLPRLQWRLAIVDNQGRPTTTFLDFFNNQFATKIETQEAAQAETLAALQAVQEQTEANIIAIQEALALAGFALETADGAAGGTARSGSATGSITLTNTFATVAQVDLLTVSAGDLTFAGSDYLVTVSPVPTIVYSYEYRIIEVDNGVDNGSVFDGSFNVFRTSPSSIRQVQDTSAVKLADFSAARTTTGSISYRVEARYVSPTPPSTTLLFNPLFARRS